MSKRIFAIFLSCIIFCIGCTQNVATVQNVDLKNSSIENLEEKEVDSEIANSSMGTIDCEGTTDDLVDRNYSCEISSANYEWDDDYYYGEYENILYETDPSYEVETLSFNNIIPEYNSLNDDELLVYVEEKLYDEIANGLNCDEYYVESINAIYVSQEYIDELAYNSRSNVYFGYTLDELDDQFQDTRYVFTLGDNGETIVQPFEEYEDVYAQVLQNVAIGTGVILICVTVSVVSGAMGASAVSVIFATSAKTATVMAVSTGTISAVTSGITVGIETGNFEEALNTALLTGSEEFKWGAIVGAVAGGTGKWRELESMAESGLTLNDATRIQAETGWPARIISQFKSMEEYEIYREAGLRTAMIDGKLALVRDINLSFMTQLPDGQIVTNLERMKMGLAPIDPQTGLAYQLHHINQKADATLAILTQAEHQGNATILNTPGISSEIDRQAFNEIRKNFWRAFANAIII